MNFDALRQKIIDKAIRGELVPQLESEPEIEQNGESQMAHPFHIPEKWKWIKLKHLATIVSGTSYKADDIQRSGVRIIRGGNLIGNVIKPCKDDVFLPHNFTSEDKTVASTDIVIVSSTGSKEGIGRSAVLGEKFECQIGAFLRIVRPKEKENSKYLQVLFRSNYYREYIRNIVSGTNINNIKNSYIEEFYAPVPPQEEQSRICSKLHECFSILAHAEHAWNELQALSENLKALLLLKAIKGEIVPQLESEPTVEQPGEKPHTTPFQIPVKWKWAKLKEIGKIVGGGTPKSGQAEYWESGSINWFTPADLGKIDSMFVYESLRKITKKGLDKSSATLMPKNSVILSSRAPIGYLAIAGNPCSTNQGCKSFVPSENFITPEWAYYAIKSRVPDIISRASGTTFKEISAKGVAETLIPLPPLGEQKRICSKLNELLGKIGELGL